MDVFQHRYYRLGRILMSLNGTWPYQSIHTRRGILAAWFLLRANLIGGQIVAIVTYRHDWNILLECVIPNVVDALCATKYICTVRNSRNIMKLLDRIRTDWEVWARQKEVTFLHEYAERGEKITTALSAVVYSATFFFTIQPMITKAIDIVLKNGTEPGKFPYPVVYYYIDMQKYYHYLIMYGVICALVSLTAIVSSEVWLIIYVHQVCGVFAAVGHKLERIGDNDTSAKTRESPCALDKTIRVGLASCIDTHNDAIEYADLIKASYVWNFFFTIMFGMILLNATELQILLTSNDLGATLTFTGVTLAALFMFYVECAISQILIDHSISIRFYIHNSKWYRLSPKTQKILQFMTMRCNLPCQLTAGNMLIISVQSFGLTMRAAMSYFAFMRSMQGK